MSTTTIGKQLVNYLEDAHALKQHMAKALEVMMSSAPDMPELQQPLSRHREATQRHLSELEQRLRAHDAAPSKVKDAGMVLAALGKGILDKARTDTAGKTARDGYTAVHLAIASYELLERVAIRVGDEETAAVARRNREDETAMAQTLAGSWDLALDLSLKQEGLDGAPPFSSPDTMSENPRPPNPPSSPSAGG